MTTRTIPLLAIIAASLALAACSSSAPAASEECMAAAEEAVVAERDLYDSHPYHDAEIPGVDASDEDWAAYDALRDDEEAQWLAIQIPIYQSCNGPDEWLAAADKYPLIAGLAEGADVDTMALELWCDSRPEDSACTGLQGWIEANGRALE